jgi:rod shape-determining protein MreC
VEHSPPPFFKRGPAPLIRLAFFASLSLTLLVLDARFHYAESLRSVFAMIAYPLQRIALAPIEVVERIGGFFATQSRLIDENAALRAKLLAAELETRRLEVLQTDTLQLRRLAGAAERQQRAASAAEILYASRDPYAQRVWLNRGAQQGVVAGSPVIDETGVVGQVTRAHPLVSEVTLITDRDQAIPVQVVRNGLRAVAFGAGSGTLELRFMAANAEIEAGDRLVTSGIDGTYPAGLPVATVMRVERDAARTFARILCEPAAGVERGRFVLVLANTVETSLPARPEGSDVADAPRPDKARRSRRKDGDGPVR